MHFQSPSLSTFTAVQRKSPFIAPCLPTLRDRSPTGKEWLHELKLDGFRIQIHKEQKRVILFSRNGHDHSDRYPFLVAALTKLPVKKAILDGELVAHNASGQPDFYQHFCTRRHPAGPAAAGLTGVGFTLLY